MYVRVYHPLLISVIIRILVAIVQYHQEYVQGAQNLLSMTSPEEGSDRLEGPNSVQLLTRHLFELKFPIETFIENSDSDTIGKN